jgi:hypothetical protein
VVTDWARVRARAIVLDPPGAAGSAPAGGDGELRDDRAAAGPDPRAVRLLAVPPAFVRKALVRAGGQYVKRAVLPLLPARVRLAAS